MPRWKRIVLIFSGVLLLSTPLLAALGIYLAVRASVPTIDGTLTVKGIAAPVTVERDGQGVPTVRAGSKEDLAFGLGFVHGQDRFFQMDSLRRFAAGELSELLGSGPLSIDRKMRRMRFREVARRVAKGLDPSMRKQIDAYVAGVASGLGSLGARPWEYLLLRDQPQPWKDEDCVLVVLALYIDLQADNPEAESNRGLMRDVLPPKLAEFLDPRGSVEWDAPLFGGPITPPPIPGPEVIDLRKPARRGPRATPKGRPPRGERWTSHEGMLDETFERPMLGSNNWAVAGSRTADGRAWLADDMHLALRLPNIWYRVRLDWQEAGTQARRSAVGVTIPGGPGLVVGSNGKVAWGFTNSQGDWSDLIELEVDPADPKKYRSHEGPRSIETIEEHIKVKGQADTILAVETTHWGPVVDEDHKGRKRVLRWVAAEPGGTDLGLIRMIDANTLEEALDLANTSGTPHQNFVVADDRGRIAWTILGRIPKRVGFDGTSPTSWADGTRRWEGFYDPKEYPRLINPESGQIWTANSRTTEGENLRKIGYGRYDRGARAKQIRDGLASLSEIKPEDLLAIQRDHRALFLERWRGMLLDVLTPETVASDPRLKALRGHVEDWGGKASIDSVGFRMVLEFRSKIVSAVLDPLTAACRRADPEFRLTDPVAQEVCTWAIVRQKPPHLLDPAHKSWDELLKSVAKEMVAGESADGSSLAKKMWGQMNMIKIAHPIARTLPWFASSLSMTVEPLPGARADMPLIQGPDYGASERIVVSPGAEDRSLFHMPGGQSGHPMSPFFRAGHDDWAQGRPSPLLPGPPIGTLTLQPTRM